MYCPKCLSKKKNCNKYCNTCTLKYDPKFEINDLIIHGFSFPIAKKITLIQKYSFMNLWRFFKNGKFIGPDEKIVFYNQNPSKTFSYSYKDFYLYLNHTPYLKCNQHHRRSVFL